MTSQHTRFGNPEKPLVVYLHGWMSQGDTSKKLFGELGNEFRFFAPDIPGSGNVPFQPLGSSFDRYATWLKGEIEKVFPDTPFFLIGNSMGGMIAQELALLMGDKVKKLVLLVTSACVLDPERPINEKIWSAMLGYRHVADDRAFILTILDFLVPAVHLKVLKEFFRTLDPFSFPNHQALDERYKGLLINCMD